MARQSVGAQAHEVMPEWFSGVASLIAAVGALWAILQGRKKTKAETNGLVVQSYKLLLGDLQQQLAERKLEEGLLKEQVRSLLEQVTLLHEQKVHAESWMTIALAKQAAREGQDLANGEAENEQAS